MNRRAIIVPLAVAVSLGFAACGDDDDEKLTKSELISKAGDICKEAVADGNKVTRGDLTDPEAAEKFFGDLAEIDEKQVDELKDLNPPDNLEDDWNAYVDAQEEFAELYATTRDKAEDRDRSGLDDFRRKITPLATGVGETATKVGITGCG